MFRFPASTDARSRLTRAAAPPVILISLALAGCASSTPVAYQQLSSASQLQAVKDDEAPFQYRGTGADLMQYSRILIDPVTIYNGPDAQFGSVSQEDRKTIAEYMQQKFSDILRNRYEVVATSGADTMRLHLTLTGIETSTPVISTVSHLAPMGLVVNTALQATGRNGTFFGSVSYAAELSDSESGALRYAYVTKQTPDALDITASIGYLDAAKTGIRIGAKHLVAELQGQRTSRAAELAAPAE
jgi:hypothetical protein